MQRTKEHHPVPEQESGPSEPKRRRRRKAKSSTSLTQEPITTMVNNHTLQPQSVDVSQTQHRRPNSSSDGSSNVGAQRWDTSDRPNSTHDVEEHREIISPGLEGHVQPHHNVTEVRQWMQGRKAPPEAARGRGGLSSRLVTSHDELRDQHGRGEVQNWREGRGMGSAPGRSRVGLQHRFATHLQVDEEPRSRQAPRAGGILSRDPLNMETRQEARPRYTAGRGGYQSPSGSLSQPPLSIPNPNSSQRAQSGYNTRQTQQYPRSRDFARPESPTNVWGPDTIPYISAYDWTSSHPDPRETVPAYLLDPAQRTAISIDIMKMWMESAPSASQKKEVARTVRDVDRALKNRWPRLNGKVDVFGSCSWGGECGNDGGKVVDLDLTYRDFSRPKGYTPELWGPGGLKNPLFPAVYNVHRVGDALRTAGFAEVQPIKFASTPIVKFKDPTSQISLDLNINDLGGWYNSSLMLAYCRISPYVLRPLIHFVKLWAKRRNFNDAAGARGPASFSSYALGLMCIAYLQGKGLLPNLQDPELVRQAGREECYAYVGWNKPEGTRLLPGFVDELPPGVSWKPSNPHPEIGEIVHGFFDCHHQAMGFETGKIKLDPSHWTMHPPEGLPDTRQYAISVLNGGWIKRGRPIHTDGALANEAELKEWQSEQEKAYRDRTTNKDGDTMDVAGSSSNGNGFTPNNIAKAQPNHRDRNISKAEPPASAEGQPWHWAKSALVVRDPFLHEKNCTRGIEKPTFLRASIDMGRTKELMGHANPSLKEIFELLEPPLTKAEKKASRFTPAQGNPPNPTRTQLPPNTTIIPGDGLHRKHVPEKHTGTGQNNARARKNRKAKSLTEDS